MTFIDRVLKVPSYGWADNQGQLIIPDKKELFKEYINGLNIFKDRKKWISFLSWSMIFLMLPFFISFLFYHLSIFTFIFFIIYSFIIMSTHGTIWFHRYCTHKSYKFSNPIWRIITQNLVIKTIPEETYVISHHVHHVKSDQPGDPYNARAGLMYCMTADVNHQRIAEDLNESDYRKALKYMSHTGVKMNSYKGYQKWGSIASPLYSVLIWVINWAFWYGIFYLIGGHGMATAAFSAALFWFLLVRAFNYTGHGKGEVAHKEGIDFDRSNLSINQTRPGWFSGEWHNNHHLYPNSARAGFLNYQLDLAWIYIYCLSKIGMVSSFNDSKKEFLKKYT